MNKIYNPINNNSFLYIIQPVFLQIGFYGNIVVFIAVKCNFWFNKQVKIQAVFPVSS